MKTKILTLMTLLFLGLWSNFYCQSSQDRLYGIWTFDYNNSIKNMNNEAKSNFFQMNENHQIKIKLSYKGRKLILNEDQSFNQISGDGSQFSGNWEYNEQENLINLKYSDGMVYPLMIIQNTYSKLVMKPQVVDYGKPLFQEWHFTKD